MSDQSTPLLSDEPPLEYRLVTDFPDYRVGNDGSLWRKSTADKYQQPAGGWFRLRGSLHESGHVSIALCSDSSRRVAYLHHLVLEAFVGPCPDGLQCRHLNDIGTDNRLSNLCWGTSAENHEDALRNDGTPHGSRHHAAKFDEATVAQIKKRLLQGETCVALGEEFGVHQMTISKIKLGTRWKRVKPAL